MGFEILPSIPPNMRGRGSKACVPMKCECGSVFLWEHKNGRGVTCPSCRVLYRVTDAAFDQTHNGQQK